MLTAFAANKLLDYVWSGTSFSLPGTWYIAAFNGDPAAGGTEMTSTGSYARRPFPTLASSSGGLKSSTADVTFATATANWSAIWTHWAIMDASSGGNVWDCGALATPRTVILGDIPKLYAGQVNLRFTVAT